ncbi:MAG: zinc-dependent metalloprotease [Candidatus Nanopelagicales bacterium]
MPDVVDWDLAVATATRFAPRGPELPAAEARAAVRELRTLAAEAVAPVRERTGLVAEFVPHATEVVDRPTWTRSNIDGFRVALRPLLDRMRERRAESPALVSELGSRATALQMGGALAWLSGKVLGQYEALVAPGAQPRLLLVAPNIVTAERALEVDPRDFRLWVCLHEETHRVQFGAVPWLADHFAAEVHEFLVASDLDASELLGRLVAVLRAGTRIVGGDEQVSLIEEIQTPAQRVVFDRLTALMSLLEGHADHVMDDVGPDIVPSVAEIRRRFEHRRSHPGAVDGLARRLLGMDAKLRQYSDGAAFVRAVVDKVGVTSFNRVWESPQTLPTRAEIADPPAWIRRMRATGPTAPPAVAPPA